MKIKPLQQNSQPKPSRRNVLKGAGTVAIALPWLEEKGFAQEAPKRLTTVFFGNGIPAGLTQAGLVGPLSPLAEMRDKICLLKGVGVDSGNSSGFHDQGSASFGTGTKTSNESRVGPSIDYLAYQALKPNTDFDVVSAAIVERVQEKIRYVRSWRSPGDGVEPHRTPLSFFTQVFGSLQVPQNPGAGDATAVYNKSILDGIVKQYQHLTSSNSPYSNASKQQLTQHLDRIRELERKVLAAQQTMEMQTGPGAQNLSPAESLDAFVTNLGKQGWNCGIPIKASELQTVTGEYDNPKNKNVVLAREYCWVWPILAEIYGMAMRTGKAHFGSMICFGGGDRTKHGQYSGDWAHEYYHGYENRTTQAHYYIQEIMQFITYLLKVLDNDSYLEANGKTVLDNSMVVIGTELARQHRMDNMFYAVAGGLGILKTGQDLSFPGRYDVELYNTILHGMGVDVGAPNSREGKIGDTDRFNDFLDIFI